MSFRSNPFDRLSHLDPESRLNQFRQRFDNMSQNANQMFGDSDLADRTNRWSKASNGMPSERNHSFDGHNEGIPIKVIHEKSDPISNAEQNYKSSDSMSSFGSSQSQRSGSTSHSSGSVFNSSRSHQSSDSGSSQPRVHHIPITIEPRDGSSSSGYTSEVTAPVEQPLSRSSSHSSAHSLGNTVRSRSRTESPAPTDGQPEVSEEDKKRVRQIPIQVEAKDVQKSVSPNSGNVSKSKAQNSSCHPKAKPKSGPFVTRIPVVNQTNNGSQPTEPTAESENKEEKSPKKVDPMQAIDNILNDLRNYENQVKQFEGSVDDKKYRYLDEMLTRCMIKLDTIETNGSEEIRKARKAAVLAVNQCIGLLEQKISQSEQKLSQTSDETQAESRQTEEESMQVSTPEPSNQQTIEEPMVTNESQNTNQNDSKPEVVEQTSDQKPVMENSSNGSHAKETAV